MSKVTEWVSPSCNPEEESDGESLNVTVWIAESKFVHVTVSPTRMVSADGAKLNPLMSIAYEDGCTTGTDVVVSPIIVVVGVGSSASDSHGSPSPSESQH